MNIGEKTIVRDPSGGEDVYVIAELGVNHDGSVDRAVELVGVAADAGADAVKLQLFDADLLMSRSAKLAAYQRAAGEDDPVAMLRRLQLCASDMRPVIEEARRRGLHAIVTVFSTDLVEEAEGLGWDAYKTASPDIVHKPLLESLMRTGKPLIVSTGASTIDEVARAHDWLKAAKDRLALLQCVSSYPTPRELASIGAIEHLRARFETPVGYSDHTADEETGAIAAAFGASVLEKHLTYDRSARGPDHGASLDPRAFASYVRGVRLARRADSPTGDPRIGDPIKRVLECEGDVRSVSRQSIVSSRAMPAGHTITRDDLAVKRPGTGLPPEMLGDLPGRRTKKPIESDRVIEATDLD